MSNKQNFDAEKEEAKAGMDHVINGLILMPFHLIRGKGYMYFPGVITLIAALFVIKHPLLILLTIAALLRGLCVATDKIKELKKSNN